MEDQTSDFIFGKSAITIHANNSPQLKSGWFSIHSLDNRNLEIDRVEISIETVNSEALDEKLVEKQVKINELEQRLQLGQLDLEKMKRPSALNTSMQDMSASYVNYQVQRLTVFSSSHSNIAEDHHIHILSPVEKLRNFLCYMMCFTSIIICFARSDFFTIIIFFRLSLYFEKFWESKHYLEVYGLMVISILYDVCWLMTTDVFQTSIVKHYVHPNTMPVEERRVLLMVYYFSFVNLCLKVVIVMLVFICQMVIQARRQQKNGIGLSVGHTLESPLDTNKYNSPARISSRDDIQY